MSESGVVRASAGLKLRDSPRDGTVLDVLHPGTHVEILGRETWLHVRVGGQAGFVLGDFVESLATAGSATSPRLIHESPLFAGAPLEVHRDFLPSVQIVEAAARSRGLTVVVTSSLRRPGAPIQGAIVEPAKASNHWVGHALDMNLRLDGTLFTSTALGQLAAQPVPIQSFIAEIKQAGLRWGGDFEKRDPVHIDDGLNHRDPAKFAATLAALWG